MALRKGQLVQVRSRQEILATLDDEGCLDGMPFMPEMLRFCGCRLRVAARAHKTCDTVNKTGGVRVESAAHLEDARCDGAAHGGCQAACLLFWKEAWLRPVEDGSLGAEAAVRATAVENEKLPERWSVRSGAGTPADDIRYRCQATELPRFTSPLQWWDVRQYIEDLTSGNIGIRTLVRGARFALVRALVHFGVGYRVIVAFYNWYQKRVGGSSLPWVTGTLKETPIAPTTFQPGDMVTVKSFEEIMGTLDSRNRNRGLGIDLSELQLQCNKTYRVARRIDRILNEQTGRMMRFTTSCAVLEGVYCTGETPQTRLFCPRAITPYWRDVWLRRADSDFGAASGPANECGPEYGHRRRR